MHSNGITNHFFVGIVLSLFYTTAAQGPGYPEWGVGRSHYQLQDDYEPATFFDNFDFITTVCLDLLVPN
jgi:hypothetical protein